MPSSSFEAVGWISTLQAIFCSVILPAPKASEPFGTSAPEIIMRSSKGRGFPPVPLVEFELLMHTVPS